MNDYNDDIEYNLLEESQKRIETLIINYEYEKYSDFIMLLYNTYFKFCKIENKEQESEVKQVTGLIMFLEKTYDKTISLKGIISKPDEGEIKGESINYVLNNSNLKSCLINFLHSYLTEKRGGRYHIPCNNNENISLKYLSYIPTSPKEEDIHYNYNELNDIFNEEVKASKNRKLGELSYIIFESLVQKGIFNPQPTIKTYCFIYDFISLIEGINIEKKELYTYSGDEAKWKYDKVRYWISAYKAKKQTLL